MTTPEESIVLCEGFHDRAFLAAWLIHEGCESWEKKTYPPKNRRVTDGQFAFRSPRGGWVRIVPMHGGDSWKEKAEVELRPETRQLLIILDDDTEALSSDARRQAFDEWRESEKVNRRLADKNSPTSLHLIVWRAHDKHADHLPRKQTLERLVCAAIAEAHPERGEEVSKWLASRSKPLPEKSHKAHAASHMAGWFSESGSFDFYRAIWEDEKIRAAIESRLQQIGATEVLRGVLA